MYTSRKARLSSYLRSTAATETRWKRFSSVSLTLARLKVIGIRLRSPWLACEPSKCCSSRLLSFPFPYDVFLLMQPRYLFSKK